MSRCIPAGLIIILLSAEGHTMNDNKPFLALEISLSRALLAFVTISLKSGERFVIQCEYKTDNSKHDFYYEIAESDLCLILGSPSLYATLVKIIEQELDFLARPQLTDSQIEAYIQYIETYRQGNHSNTYPKSIDDFLRSATLLSQAGKGEEFKAATFI